MQEIINNIIWIFNANPVAQTIWLIAFFFQLFAFLNKSDNKRLILQLIWFLIWVWHYALMWLIGPALIYLTLTIRNLVSIKIKPNLKITYIFIILHLLNWYFTYENIYSLLPIIWWFISLISVLHFRWLVMRNLSVFWALLWLVYNIVEWSIWWVITIVILTSANIITIIRIIRDKKKDAKLELKRELEPEYVKVKAEE